MNLRSNPSRSSASFLTTVRRHGRILLASLALGTMTVGSVALPESAHALSLLDEPRYAAILMDADTGEVLYARSADAERMAASITKVMTLYITFEELKAGRLRLSDRVTFSEHAASQPPSKLGIPRGGSISVEQAINVLATKSANDVASALAERLSGSEPAFAARMTHKAKSLGMRDSVFANASGLPDPAHHTTARDLATLSSAMLRHFPNFYPIFSAWEYEYEGRILPNHNRLMRRMPGMDGIKTGYTVASGFTLAASAKRGDKRLVAVVLGAPTARARDDNVEALLDAGFTVLDYRALGKKRVSVAMRMAEPEDVMFASNTTVEQGSGDVEAESDKRLPTIAGARP